MSKPIFRLTPISLKIASQRYLTRPKAAMMVLVVDNAKLARSHSMYLI